MANKPPGKIVTFYSYKGGTGRSMALANVAWILASQGKRVLTLDWDLEAPGLHRYFHPFLVDKELTSSDGLIDFVIKFAVAAATSEPTKPTADGRQANGATVYLAETTPDLAASRDTVKNVLLQSGYTVLPYEQLPLDALDFDVAVRNYLKSATLSVHLIGQPLTEDETYPFVHRQNALASERDNEPDFSRLIWQPPAGLSAQPSPSELLLGEPLNLEAHSTVTLLQAPLDELFNAIRKRIEKDQGDKDWYKPYANILRYASSLDWNFSGNDNKGDGSLDLIPAGRQGPSYSTRVNSFNWQNFYDRLGGGVLIEIAKERMRAEYDYVLIDSRTGVSDTSGICTVQMPDILVVCFTLNNQSIEGAAAVAESVYAQRRDTSGQTGFRIFPVPTRVEKFEKNRLELAREVAHARFNHLLAHIETEDERSRYWGDVEIYYEPFYAYEETLATFGDKPHQTNSMLASVERLTGYLTNNEVTQLEAMSESDRQIVLAKYARQTRQREPAPSTKPAQEYLFYLSYTYRDDIELIEKFFSDLSNEVRIRLGIRPSEDVGFFNSKMINVGDGWVDERSQAVESSRVLVPLFSPAYFKSEWCGEEFQYFLNRAKATGLMTAQSPVNILPIIWIPTGELPDYAMQIQWFSPEGGLRRLMRFTKHSDEYEEFLDDLANRLIDVTQELQPSSPQEIPSFKAVRSAFEETAISSTSQSMPDFDQTRGGPGTANFTYVVARPEEMSQIRSNVSNYDGDSYNWRPLFPSDDKPIGITAAAIAGEELMLYEMLPVDDNLLTRVLLAEQNNSPVILIVDPWTIRLAQYRKILQKFDGYAFTNCAVLIVWNEQDDETKAMTSQLEQDLKATFPFHLGASREDLYQVRSKEELHQTLSRSLHEIRSRIMERGQVIKRLEIGEDITKPNISRATDAE